MNYTTLQADVAAYLHRTDLTSQIPTFIGLAEAFLFRELNVKELQTTATLVTTGEYAPLPADFGSLSRLSNTVNGVTYDLDYQASPEYSTSTTSVPSKFGFEKGQIRVYGAGTGTTLAMYYTPKIEALSGSVATNWLTDNASDLYLFATCLEGAKYIRAKELAMELDAMVKEKIEGLKRFIERKGQPATSSLQIKVRRG